MAAQIKEYFRKNHVYITTESEADIELCRNLFYSIKRKNAHTSWIFKISVVQYHEQFVFNNNEVSSGNNETFLHNLQFSLQ